ncbi:MAG: hypothetical protein LBL59_03530 [Xanthomonadaceae bacterium]|nr:hypothetical protein [Xanthomonadaceae bacterium]
MELRRNAGWNPSLPLGGFLFLLGLGWRLAFGGLSFDRLGRFGTALGTSRSGALLLPNLTLMLRQLVIHLSHIPPLVFPGLCHHAGSRNSNHGGDQ